MILIGSPDEIRALVTPSLESQPILLRAQTSGPCVHCEDGTPYRCTYPYDDGRCPHLDDPAILCPVKDACSAMSEVARMREACEAEQEEQVSSLCGYYDERSEHVDNIDPCTHPDACKTGCPYLDDDGIYCPQKDEWSAASKQAEEDLAWAWGDDIPKFVPLAQDPEGRGTDMVAEAPDTIPRSDYVLAPRDPQGSGGGTEVPEFPALEPDEAAPYKVVAKKGRAPGHVQEWTAEEDAALLGAANRHEALALYHERISDSERSDAAIQRRWYDIREPRERARAARRDEWSAEEDAALIQASAVADVVDRFREAFPDSERSDKAITSRFYRVRTRADRLHEAAPPAAPVEVVPPVTRESPDLTAPLSAPIAPGDRVALVDDPGLVGTAVIVNNRSKFASVEFPGDRGPARVYPLSALRRVIV